MRHKLLKAVLAASVAAALPGCYRVTYNMDPMAAPGAAQSGQAVRAFRAEVKSSHVVWGLVNPNDNLVRQTIDREVKLAGGKRARHVRLTREIGLIDGVIGTVTLGIYTPWTLVIEGEVVR
jgi:hypothetical protein